MLAAIHTGALLAITTMAFCVFFVIAAFLAYAIKNQPWDKIQESNVFSIVVQAGIGTFGLVLFALLMFDGVVSSEVGTPIITGLIGLAAGKTLELKTKS